MQIQPLPTTPIPPSERPVSRTHPVQAVSSKSGPAPKKKNQKKRPILIALVALVLLGAVIAWQMLSTQIQSDKYQAVFLNNGQVYFGKLHGYYGDKAYMTDVHYFQANSQTTSKDSDSGNQLLVKLGSEVHAPEGKLILNKDAILFVENLTDGSKVTEAIKNETQATDASANTTRGITR